MGPYGLGFPQDGVADHGWQLYITSLVVIICSGLTVVARIATRHYMDKLGWDDAAIVVSLIFSIVVSVCMQLAIEYGYGVHESDLSIPNLSMALKLFFIAQAPYKVSVCCNKVSAMLLYLRIFPTKGFRIACFVVMGIVVSWSIGAIFATILQCIPVEGAWNPTINAVCIDTDQFWIAYAVVNILTDVMVLALPIPSIMGLHLRLRDRLLLCGVFLIGSFVTITSILRTTSVSNSLANKSDITYNFIQRGMWTLIECNLGIISACLPVLRQPLARFFPRMFGSTKGASGYVDADDSRNPRRGYNLSKVSASGTPQQRFWKDTKSKPHHVVSVQDVEASRDDRLSDEQRITNAPGPGSVPESDSEVDFSGRPANTKSRKW